MSNSDLPVLYSFRRCPYAMRARMALVYSNVKVELREVDLKNKPDAFSAISPKATVPVLFINDDTILDESLDIIHWALKIKDSDGWNDLAKDQVNLTELLITENDSSFKTQLDKYKYSQRFPEYSEMQYRLQGEKFLVKLNDLLKNTHYLVKDKLTYADIAIAPFIRQFVNVDIDWFKSSEYSLLNQWLDSILGSRFFEKAMHKYPVWSPIRSAENETNIFP